MTLFQLFTREMLGRRASPPAQICLDRARIAAWGPAVLRSEFDGAQFGSDARQAGASGINFKATPFMQ
jgi:hypothetical protein